MRLPLKEQTKFVDGRNGHQYQEHRTSDEILVTFQAFSSSLPAADGAGGLPPLVRRPWSLLSGDGTRERQRRRRLAATVVHTSTGFPVLTVGGSGSATETAAASTAERWPRNEAGVAASAIRMVGKDDQARTFMMMAVAKWKEGAANERTNKRTNERRYYLRKIEGWREDLASTIVDSRQLPI